jgi:hypothetical protein
LSRLELRPLSVITGGGKWVEITTHVDPLYQHLIVTAERKFWRSVESGEPPRLFGVEPRSPGSRQSELSIWVPQIHGRNLQAYSVARGSRFSTMNARRQSSKHSCPRTPNKLSAMVSGPRSKSGAVSFDLLDAEANHAAL